VVRTLRNAIERGGIHHAYLFVGSRGTGKTSMAKILAAALNCVDGPTVNPCGKCASCEAIASSTSLDVIEMDAASNNSVDDIRDLRERVSLAPVSGGWKVYILDEAHMLSSSAWNAFLKTLEEPPPNTVFVLATTEARKVLATVADRCHRFDFHRPSVVEVSEVLTRVAASEQIVAPPEVLGLVARAADGSFRDALGTLEQLTTYSSADGLTMEDALAVLGLVDSDLRFRALDAVIAADPAAAVRVAAEIASSGRDIRLFLSDLEDHGRALLLVQLAGEVPPELSVTEDLDARLEGQARQVGRGGVVALLDLVAEANSAIRDGSDARLRLELLLVKAAERSQEPSSLLERIERLEASGPAQPQPVARVTQETVASQPVESPSVTAPSQPQPQPRASAAPAAAVATAPLHAVSETPAQAEPEAPAPQTRPDVNPDLDLDAVSQAWPKMLERLGQDSGLLPALLERAWPLKVTGATVTVAFPEEADFHRRKAEDSRSRELIVKALETTLSARVELEFELSDEEPTAGPAAQTPITADEFADAVLRELGGTELTATGEQGEAGEPA
jgi:DNA polymerase-3 subunit gamma/tau